MVSKGNFNLLRLLACFLRAFDPRAVLKFIHPGPGKVASRSISVGQPICYHACIPTRSIGIGHQSTVIRVVGKATEVVKRKTPVVISWRWQSAQLCSGRRQDDSANKLQRGHGHVLSRQANNSSKPTSIRRAAQKQDTATLVALLENLQPVPRELDLDVDTSGRNPLHHAAWRGSEGNVQLLLDSGCDPNKWSHGLYSYGKTPIFYATTRCRDSIVLLLLKHGARTRIVNNKGQTVLSLAASHLAPQTVTAIEAAEMREGEESAANVEWLAQVCKLSEERQPAICKGGWIDFQSSHPDGQTYGDLDPRFHDCSPGDILTKYAVNPTTHESRRYHKHLPGSRSLRWFPPATKSGAKKKAERDHEHAPKPAPTLSDAEVEAAISTVVTMLKSRATPRQLAVATEDLVSMLALQKSAWLPPIAVRLRNAAGNITLLQAAAAFDNATAFSAEGAGSQDKHRKRVVHLRRRLLIASSSSEEPKKEKIPSHPKAIADIAAESRLTEQASLEHRNKEGHAMPTLSLSTTPMWINNTAGLEHVRVALEEALFVGMDTEWAGDGWESSSLATIQLAMGVDKEERVFVIDCGSGVAEEYRVALNILLETLLSAGTAQLVGFGFGSDAAQLARWMTQSENWSDSNSGDSKASDLALTAQIQRRFCQQVIDVQSLAIGQGLGSAARVPSLRDCCIKWLDATLDKTEQCSDWKLRPLRQSQLKYAALDACACLRLLAAMGDDHAHDSAAITL